MYYLVRWKYQFYAWDVIIEGNDLDDCKVVESLLFTYRGKEHSQSWLKGQPYHVDKYIKDMEKVVAKDKNLEKLKEKYYLELL